MREFWEKYHGDIIGVGVALIIAIGAGIWAFAKSWSGPLLIPLVLGVIAIGLFIRNQIAIAATRWSGNPKKIESTLQDWLLSFNFTARREIPLLPFVFHLTGEDPQGRRFMIAQFKGEPFIRIGVRIEILPEDYSKVDAIPEPLKTELYEDMKIEMARLRVSYNIPMPLRTFEIEDLAPCDTTLTKMELLRHILAVRCAHAVLAELISRLLRTARGGP